MIRRDRASGILEIVKPRVSGKGIERNYACRPRKKLSPRGEQNASPGGESGPPKLDRSSGAVQYRDLSLGAPNAGAYYARPPFTWALALTQAATLTQAEALTTPLVPTQAVAITKALGQT